MTAPKPRARRPRPDEAELQRRRAACAECPERREDGSQIKCRLCRVCGDREAWAVRRRCPASKWGRENWEAEKAQYEGGKP